MRFPKHRQPTNISNYERLIPYAVAKLTQRWSHEVEAGTFAHVPNLRNAPATSSATVSSPFDR
jgi:hypothetical protein